VLALPVMAITAVLIKLESRGPCCTGRSVSARTARPSSWQVPQHAHRRRKGRPPGLGHRQRQPRHPRRRIIRKLRIDELPQLFNVLKGDMSLVGPRPERPFFVEQLTAQIPYFAARHSVKPGVTGWAQVRYQYGSTVEDSQEKLQYDLYYVKNHSLFLDIVILFETVFVVLTAKGAR
jgi:lipopolysaccharide/colanic/teichoic acid biosynthesis glycosyltransferase